MSKRRKRQTAFDEGPTTDESIDGEGLSAATPDASEPDPPATHAVIEKAVAGEDAVVSAATQDDLGSAVAAEDVGDAPDERQATRRTHRVKTVVHFKESADENWRESIEIVTVSRNGAGMLLSRPCPVGRIVSLIMDMPLKLRLYDHFAEVYPVAGVVQNCTELNNGDGVGYHVGVAFIGKQLPESYRGDPTTTYRITGADSDGLWCIAPIGSRFHDREHARYWTQVSLSITYRDEVQKRIERASVQTRDISRGGTAIRGPLNIGIGEKLKVSSKEHDFFSVATVRNRTDDPRDGSKSLVHIQFEDPFPVEMIPAAQEPAGDSEHEHELVARALLPAENRSLR